MMTRTTTRPDCDYLDDWRDRDSGCRRKATYVVTEPNAPTTYACRTHAVRSVRHGRTYGLPIRARRIK